jgi:acyl-coenzyme A thioesterase PaaI-like protein
MIDKTALLERQKTIPLAEHHNKFCKPDFLTSCFRKSVPVLDFVDWHIVELKEGYCKSRMPFVKSAKNQNASHQAALFLLAADYTGGIALCNHIKLPSFGIHPEEYWEDFGLVFLTVHSEVKYKKLSTKNLIAVANINEQEIQNITNYLFRKGRIIQSINVGLKNEDEEMLGTVTMKYLIQLLSLKEWQEYNNHNK